MQHKAPLDNIFIVWDSPKCLTNRSREIEPLVCGQGVDPISFQSVILYVNFIASKFDV